MDNIDRYALEARLAEIEEALAELDAVEGDEALFDYEREMNEDDYAGEDGEMEEVRLGVSRESDEDGFWDEIWDAYRDRRWTNYWNKSGIK